MKTLLSIFLMLFVLTTAFAQQTLQEPTTLSDNFFRAMLDEDSKTLSTLIASDMTFTSFNGDTIDSDSLVQSINDGSFTLETATVADTHTRQLTNDTALITGEWKAKGIFQGDGFNDTMAFSVLCVKQGNRWKIVNVQFTPVRQ